jgi:hypothetical protein
VGRHCPIGTDLHQFPEQGLRVVLQFNAVALIRGLGLGLLGRCRCGQRLGQTAAEGLKAFAAAGVEAHDRSV